MNFHELAQPFPMLDDSGLKKLADSIKTNGQLVPILLYDDRYRGAFTVDPTLRNCKAVEPSSPAVIGGPLKPFQAPRPRMAHGTHPGNP